MSHGLVLHVVSQDLSSIRISLALSIQDSDQSCVHLDVRLNSVDV